MRNNKLLFSTIIALSVLASSCAHKNTNVVQDLKSEYTGNEDRYPAGGGPGEEALTGLIKTLATASKQSEASVASVIRSRVPEAANLGKAGYKINDSEQLKIVERVKLTRATIAKDLKISTETVEQAANTAAAGKSSESVWSTMRRKEEPVNTKTEVHTSGATVNDAVFASAIKGLNLTTESVQALGEFNSTMVSAGISSSSRAEALASAAKAAEAAKTPIIKQSCKDIVTDAEALTNSKEVTDLIPGEIKNGRTPAEATENSIARKFNEDKVSAKERCTNLCKDPCNHFNCKVCM